MEPINLNDVRLCKRRYSALVEIDYLEPLFQRVDKELVRNLIVYGKKYISSLAEYWQIVVPYQKVFEIERNQCLSSTNSERQAILTKRIAESKAEIQETLNNILVSSLSFGENTEIGNYAWDYVDVSNEEHVIGSCQKTHFNYSYARLFIDQDLFYFGLELYIINEFEACAYQKVVLFRYPGLVPY